MDLAGRTPGEAPVDDFGGWKVGMRFVRVYVATWNTEYIVKGSNASGTC